MFSINSWIGVPVVVSSNTPERIWTASASLRWVVYLLWPGFLASMKGWMSLARSFNPGGHPSSTAPRAGPWLSPHVVKRKTRPNVFQLMGPSP